MIRDIRDRSRLEDLEQEHLRSGAALSGDPRLTSRAHLQDPDGYRTEFQRDYTRIIHSHAFRRLRHKTQVFISPSNDHLCTRLEHSLHVASVATTIARAMGLNEHLVQAIAIGHDLGHAPFGHEGEKRLHEIAEPKGLEFCHELHGLRVVDKLDSPYQEYSGLNLTFAVRDGIACHYGEGFEKELRPDLKKQPDGLARMTREDRGKARPATLEGCVVRWSDKIAYLGRDLEDALELRMPGITKNDVPVLVEERLGLSNKEIIHALISSLLENSSEDALAVSEDIHEALNALYKFNMTKIYKSDQATRFCKQVSEAMKMLFQYFLERIQTAQASGDFDLPQGADNSGATSLATVLPAFLDKDVRDWRDQRAEQLAIDFLAGMTDSYFVASFKEAFCPRGI